MMRHCIDSSLLISSTDTDLMNGLHLMQVVQDLFAKFLIMYKAFDSTQEVLYKRVFRVLVRLSTNQESGSQFMDKNYYSNLIYEKVTTLSV
jgi:hypothetical protein